MALTTIVPFDRALSGVVIAGDTQRRYSEVDLAKQVEQAYRRGLDAARAEADQQVVELRAELERLRDDVFARLLAIEPALINQARDALPALAVDLARRLLAGFEPSSEMTVRICEEALTEMFPARDDLELLVSPDDAARLAAVQPNWATRFPRLRITADPNLKPGDCQVRSRFGVADARLETKLAAVRHSLLPA